MSIQIDEAAAYDLLMGFHAVTGGQARGPWADWARRKADELTVARLRRWRQYRFASGYVALIPTLPQPRGVQELLHGIASMPVSDFLRVALTIDYIAPDAPLAASDLAHLTEDKSRARAFVDRYLRATGHQRASLLRILPAPRAAQVELVELLEWFAHNLFADIEPDLREERYRAAQRLRELEPDSPERWPEWLPPYADFTGFSPVVLAPSGFLGSDVFVYFHETQQALFDHTQYEPFIIAVGAQRALGPTSPVRLRRAASAGLPAAEAADRYAPVFAALGDPSRLRLVHLLAQRPRYGQELAAELGISAASISHHISVLMKAGFLAVERQSHRTYYVLREETVGDLLDTSRRYVLGEGSSRPVKRTDAS